MTGREIRMNKLLNKGENAVIVAVDHGYVDGVRIMTGDL